METFLPELECSNDSQSTAAIPTTTSTTPHTAAGAAADTTCEVFRGTARGVHAGTLRTCALLRELREPRCCYGHVSSVP